MIQRTSRIRSGLDKLRNYGEAIKGLIRRNYSTEKSTEFVDAPIYRVPRTYEEAAEFLRDDKPFIINRNFERKNPNSPSLPLSNALLKKIDEERALSKYDKGEIELAQRVGFIDKGRRQGIPAEELGRLSRRQSDPLSLWMSEKLSEESFFDEKQEEY